MPNATPSSWTGSVAEYAWLLQLTGGVPSGDLQNLVEADPDGPTSKNILLVVRERERQAERVAALNQLRGLVKALTDRYAKLADAEVKTLKKKSMNLVSPDGKLHEAFNAWQDTADQVPSWFDDLVRETQAMKKFADDMLDLEFSWEEQRDGRSITKTEKLFEPPEVEAELYTPVVRQLMYPEDQVPDEFSAVQRMIDETNKRYAEMLKDAEPDTGSLDTALQLTKIGISGAAALTGGILDGVKAFDPSTADAISTAKTAITISEVVINGAITVGGAIAKSDAIGASKGAINMLADAIGGIMAAADPNLKTTAKYVTLGIKASTLLPDLVDHLSQPGLAPFDRMVRIVSSVESTMIDSLSFFVVEGSNDREKADVAVYQRIMKSVVATQLKAFQTGGTADKIIRRDTKGFMADFAELGVSIGQSLLVRLAEEKKNEAKAQDLERMAQLDEEFQNANPDTQAELVKKLDVDPSDPNYAAYSSYKGTLLDKGILDGDGTLHWDKLDTDFTDLAKSTFASSVESTFSSAVKSADGDMSKLSASMGLAIQVPAADPETMAKQIEKMEQQAKQEEDLLALSSASFEQELMGFKDLSVDRLAQMTAEIKSHRMVLSIFSQAGQAGFAVAATFFAPMAAAGTLIQMIELSKKAVEHLMELRKWRENADLTQSAVSPYHTSALNFIKEETALYNHNTVQAIIKGIQFAAQVADAAGTGTPVSGVAKLVNVAAGAAATTEEIVYTAKRRYAVVEGWKITRAALDNPRDRITNLKAREMNPTLTKFTIAWGAIHAKDPVALEMFAKIGLTRDMLAVDDEGADDAYDVLIAYLETRYEEQNAIKIRRPEKSGWFDLLPPAKLLPSVWLQAVGMASEHTTFDVRQGRPVEVELGTLSGALRAVAKKRDWLTGSEKLWKSGTVIEPKAIERYKKTVDAALRAAADLGDQLDRMPRANPDLTRLFDEFEGVRSIEVSRLERFRERADALLQPPPKDEKLTQDQMKQVAQQALQNAQKSLGK